MALNGRGVAWVPITFACVLIIGCLITFTWAALMKHVTPYMPFISETGAIKPESGFFSLVLFLSSFFGMLTVLLRHVILTDVYDLANKWLRVANIFATVLGFAAFCGMAAVGAYSLSTVKQAHNAAANILFWGLFFYELIQTGITCALYRHRCRQESRFMLIFRTVITCLTFVCVVLMMILTAVGKKQYKQALPNKSVRLKEPGDPGFGCIVAAATFEWLLGLTFIIFFLTYLPEFWKVQVQLGAQKKCAIDERTSITSSLERSQQAERSNA